MDMKKAQRLLYEVVDNEASDIERAELESYLKTDASLRAQFGVERRFRQLPRIVIFADMRHRYLAQSLMTQLLQQFGSLVVVEVPPVTPDPALELIGVGTAPQHVEIVIKLEYEAIAAPVRGHHMGRNTAQVSENSQG